MPDDEKPEAAPSGDVTENEDAQKPIEPKKPVAAIPEQIESHETAPAWLKAITDRLDKIEAGIKPAASKIEPKVEQKTEPKAEVKEEERTDGQTKENPKRKSGRVKLWRRV